MAMLTIRIGFYFFDYDDRRKNYCEESSRATVGDLAFIFKQLQDDSILGLVVSFSN